MTDIARAYFNAVKDPEQDATYVELPHEDPGRAAGMCGLLRVHMYGTRAAADGWHGEYSGLLKKLGFAAGDASACVFRHAARGLVLSVHGDDFTIAGPKRQIDWLKAQMESRYELKELARLGPGPNDDKEVKILNRIVRWTASGVEYEADPRQIERVVADLGLEGAKVIGTAGVKTDKAMLEKDGPLGKDKWTLYRAIAARCNYIAADRPDIQFASKELCRWMASPSLLGLQGLKRLGRYLEGHRRLVFECGFQSAEKVEVYSDTDWAGCIKTSKSTSGDCLMIGSHLLKSWSSTQGVVSLSSGEAEFYGVTKAAGIGLGYQSLLEDLGVAAGIRVWTDSSATLGICGRQGLGKFRHIDTRSIWLHQKLRAGALEVKKVRGDVNAADLFAKHLPSEDRVVDLCRLFRCRFASGRAAGAPSLKRIGLEEKLLAVDMVYAAAGPILEQDGFSYPVGDYEGEAVPEAYFHDASQLPHLIGGDLRVLFPRAAPAEELEELPEEPDWLEQRATASRCEPAAVECRGQEEARVGGRKSRRGQATVESLQADIRAANALIAKAAFSAEDVSAATALIAKARR